MPGPYAVGCFDDQFDAVGGNNTSFKFSIDIPFDCVLQRVSAIAFAASALDAYVTVLLNAVPIVQQSDNLKMTTGIEFLVLPNIAAHQDDKLTVILNLVSSNVILRGKTVIAYAAEVKRDVVAPGYYPTYAYG